MATTQRILCGYDDTPHSRDGLALAALLARLGGRELTLVDVIDDRSSHASLTPAEERDLRHRLAHVRTTAGGIVADLPFSVLPMLGQRVTSLHKLAAEEAAELLVLGPHHFGRVARTLLGTFADATIPGSPCPVAVAPDGYRDRGGSLDTVGAAVDGSPESDAAVRIACGLAREAGARVQLIAVRPSLQARRLTGAGPSPFDAHPDRTEERLLEHAATLARDHGDVELVRLAGDPARELVRHGATLDLLVLGSRGHGPLGRALLGSVSTAVTHTATCPVIVCPRGVAHAPGRAPSAVA